MEFNKYVELRKKIKEKSFEGKNKNLSKWLYKSSYGGNVLSIAFAFFLVFPTLNNTISAHIVGGNIGIYISMFLTILILSAFEYIKRILLHNLSFDLVKYKWNILKPAIVGWFIFSVVIIGGSFYLSLTGAKNFASTSSNTNSLIEHSNKQVIDSLTSLSNNEKNIYISNLASLRESNKLLRGKLLNTDDNSSKLRKEYQSIIDKNSIEINQDEAKLKDIDNNINNKILELNKNVDINKSENKNNDVNNIVLFIILSSFIELLIIIGIYFKEYYDLTLYSINEGKMEKQYVKKERYTILLKYIFKEGKAQIGEKVPAVAPFKELIKTKTQTISSKFIDEFFIDMDNHNIFTKEGKRRFIGISYDKALELLDEFDDSSILLTEL
jgi:hypothetical protein